MNRRRSLLLAAILVGGAAAGLVWWLVASRSTVIISFPDNEDFPLPVVGHIGMVLKHTNILEKNGIRADLRAQESMPGVDDLLEQHVDVILLGQAAPLLRIDEGLDGKVVACLGAGGTMGLIVPPTSKVETVADLKGAKIAAVKGNAAHRWLVETLEAAALTEDDVEILPYSQVNLFDQRLGALLAWSPRYQAMLRRFGYRSLAERTYYQAVFFSQHFIDNRPEDAVNVLVAIKQALWFWSTHEELVHSWWIHGRGRPPARLVARILRRYNLNFRAESWEEIDLSIPDEYLQNLQKDEAFLLPRGFLKQPVNILSHIDRDLLEKADQKAAALDPALIDVDPPHEANEPADGEGQEKRDPMEERGPSFRDGEGPDGDPDTNRGPDFRGGEGGQDRPMMNDEPGFRDGGGPDDPVINRGPGVRDETSPKDGPEDNP